jgi:hypothetical protein
MAAVGGAGAGPDAAVHVLAYDFFTKPAQLEKYIDKANSGLDKDRAIGDTPILCIKAGSKARVVRPRGTPEPPLPRNSHWIKADEDGHGVVGADSWATALLGSGQGWVQFQKSTAVRIHRVDATEPMFTRVYVKATAIDGTEVLLATLLRNLAKCHRIKEDGSPFYEVEPPSTPLKMNDEEEEKNASAPKEGNRPQYSNEGSVDDAEIKTLANARYNYNESRYPPAPRRRKHRSRRNRTNRRRTMRRSTRCRRTRSL